MPGAMFWWWITRNGRAKRSAFRGAVAAISQISDATHFAKSALSRYTQWDFLDLVERHGIAWHEKTLGQLFCDGKSVQIIEMLVSELEAAGATLWCETEIGDVRCDAGGFVVSLSRDGGTLAVGALWNDGNGDRSGHVRVFAYNANRNEWMQLGQDLNGVRQDDHREISF